MDPCIGEGVGRSGMSAGMAVTILVPGFSPFRTATPFLIALLAIVLFRNDARKA